MNCLVSIHLHLLKQGIIVTILLVYFQAKWLTRLDQFYIVYPYTKIHIPNICCQFKISLIDYFFSEAMIIVVVIVLSLLPAQGKTLKSWWQHPKFIFHRCTLLPLVVMVILSDSRNALLFEVMRIEPICVCVITVQETLNTYIFYFNCKAQLIQCTACKTDTCYELVVEFSLDFSTIIALLLKTTVHSLIRWKYVQGTCILKRGFRIKKAATDGFAITSARLGFQGPKVHLDIFLYKVLDHPT